MRCKTLEQMNFVDLALTDDSAVAISSSLVLTFTFPEVILASRNGGDNNSFNESYANDSEANGKKTVNI